MKRCGLFGGTFDPIHNGHMALVRTLKEQLALDEMVLMPTAQPPHKLKSEMAPAEDRLAMCRLAAAGCPGVTVSQLEIARGGASFTADTLDALCRQCPDTEWYLCMGADMFLSVETWRRFADIAAAAVLCTVPRSDGDRARLLTHAARLEALGARCVVADMVKVDVSSTELRRRVHAGEPLDGLCPAAVADYIAAHRLYLAGDTALPTDEQIVEIIRGRLKPGRFAHSLAVAEEAERLARRYGADPVKARTAGLLHDIMKNTDPKEQLQIFSKFGILLTEIEAHSQKLWHAISGAVFAERVLGFTDREILDAVRYHTTARAGMSPLERVLYLADFTSADRDYEDVDEMRRRVDISVACAMEYALSYTIRDLVKKQSPVHPDTLDAYNEIMLKKGDV